MKFDFSKSNNSDFQNKFQYLYTRLDKILEHQRYTLELLQRIIKRYETDDNLQTQVDDYFEKDPFGSAFKESLNEAPPEEASE